MTNTCYNFVRAALEENPDQEFSPVQMRVHIWADKHHYSLSMVNKTLRKLHKDGVAERIRNSSNKPYRYSLANTI